MRTKHREEFIHRAAEAGIPLHVARAFLRLGSTLHRLAEAQCNGDWPADNGERKVLPCSRCQMCWVPSSITKWGLCPDCRTSDRALALGKEYGLDVIVNGDPRGAVLSIRLASGRELMAG